MTAPKGLGVAVDTNVLVYAEGEGDAPRCAAARELLARHRRSQRHPRRIAHAKHIGPAEHGVARLLRTAP